MEVLVRRYSIAPCVSCQLCGGFLRDATTIPDCLHSFCRECIVEKFRIEDISCCPKCGIDLGCSPLKKLRADHSLQAIMSVIFPAERHKVEDIVPLHPEELALPRSSPQAHEVDNSAEETNPFLVCEPKNSETETEECERLETEPPASLAKPIASSPHTAVAPANGPTLLVPSVGSGNRQEDAQREHTPLALRHGGRSVEEHRGAIEGMGVEVHTPISELAVQSEELKCEHRGLIDKQDTAQERKTKKATGSTLSIAVEATVQKIVSLLPAALQSEAQGEVENTARVFGRAETYSGRSQGLEADIARIRQGYEKKKAEEAAFERTRISEELLRIKSEADKSNMRLLKMIDDMKAARLRGFREHENERARNLEELQRESGDTARLREEVEYERAEKAAAFERARVLGQKLNAAEARMSAAKQELNAAREGACIRFQKETLDKQASKVSAALGRVEAAGKVADDEAKRRYEARKKAFADSLERVKPVKRLGDAVRQRVETAEKLAESRLREVDAERGLKEAAEKRAEAAEKLADARLQELTSERELKQATVARLTQELAHAQAKSSDLREQLAAIEHALNELGVPRPPDATSLMPQIVALPKWVRALEEKAFEAGVRLAFAVLRSHYGDKIDLGKLAKGFAPGYSSEELKIDMGKLAKGFAPGYSSEELAKIEEEVAPFARQLADKYRSLFLPHRGEVKKRE
ncbi:hypothetical protein EJB05_15462 [Eragrostis curvula]|uniref:RING-type domain-containing protein n=1 Tax=Eragrostis curvula TaxID=38414 RepID=A0A5J9W1U5_9POAL|nr:hypothetical protein EJB05_15462 [Eragrostis curvula]